MSVDLDPSTIEAIAREVAALLERRPELGQLLTAGQVAARFNVKRSWVYEHARELGVVRLTDSRNGRLRFDPAIVAEKLLAEAPPDPTVVARVPVRRRFVRQPTEVPLLPVRGRTLVHENHDSE